MGRSSEVLLAVRVITFGPIVLFIFQWADRRLVKVYHKILGIQSRLERVQVVLESLISSQTPDGFALEGGQGQRIEFLLLKI